MSYPDNATASLAQFLFRNSAGAMYIIPRRAFHNGAEYGDTVTLVQDLSGNGHDLTGTAVFDSRSFYGGNRPLDNVRDAQFIRDVNMSTPVSGTGTTIRAVPGGTVMFDEGALDGTITGEFSVLILIDRTLSEREKHVVSELARLWGGANWTPGALFMAGKDGVWLDPSDHSTLWIDEERTQNATQPGDVVWWIDDKSGNENNFSVDASANRSRLVRWPASAVREGQVRNRIPNSDNVSAGWNFTSTVIEEGLVLGPDGRVSASEAITSPSSGTGLYRTLSVQPGDEWTLHFYLRVMDESPAPPIAFRDDISQSWITQAATKTETPADHGYTHYSATVVVPPGCTRLRYYPVRLRNTGEPIAHYRIANLTLEPGPDAHPYQRVGAGHWDVTEEGQPDCWGIDANGINNSYASERGIPEYVDGKVRMLVGQTKIQPDGIQNGIVFTNQFSGNTGNGYTVTAHLTGSRSYFARYRSSSNTIVNTGSEYPSPHTGILDVAVISGEGRVSLRVNSDDPLSETGTAGGISDNPMGLFSFLPGDGPFYEGIIWSTILTAYAPDETLWSRVARDWLNNTNMLGVLSDDD